MIPEVYKPIIIDSITRLVKEHIEGKNCNDNCTISVYTLGILVKELQGKELDREQQKLFL